MKCHVDTKYVLSYKQMKKPRNHICKCNMLDWLLKKAGISGKCSEFQLVKNKEHRIVYVQCT